ncbi:MAG: DUF5041 domain-containing protein [Alistipes sp.]|nr:DUF5041 domain-containing protein [Alistipes sp.]
MKYFVLFAIAAACACLQAQAQQIRSVEASAEDYIELLKTSGYQAYSFSLNDLTDATYDIVFDVREYAGGELVSSNPSSSIRNRVMLDDFQPEDYTPDEVAQIKEEAYDFDGGIFAFGDRITIGFVPLADESAVKCRMSVANIGDATLRLDLKPVENELYPRPIYRYVSRPFKIESFAEGEFIPLVLYCSFWYDRKAGVVRCCGEQEIDPQLTAQILKDSPHYYIIGATIIRQ